MRASARMHSLDWLRYAGVLLLVAPGALISQSPTQRVEVDDLRDSLATSTDSVTLRELEHEWINRASGAARDSAMIHIRLGFVALRLGDLTGHQHYEDAASEFQWATELQPAWPYGWFGLGLAELGIGDASSALMRGLQAAFGKDALTRSADDFAKSAEVDPAFVGGLVELANTALKQRINIRLDVAREALRRAASTPAARDPAILLARARIEREVGSPDSARVAIDELLARDSTNAAGLLEAARVRFAQHDPGGARYWYRGLGLADSAALAAYRSDLRFLLADSTLHCFDTASVRSRLALMHRFWSSRDHDELRSAGSRLMEHYRRLAYARQHYLVATTHRHYDIIERYRPAEVNFDDRGVIYLRHGEPDATATLALPELPFNESWVYHRPGEPDLLLHFVAREGVTDFRLVESALDVLGYPNVVHMLASGDVQGRDGVVFGNPATPISRDSADHLRQYRHDAAISNIAAEVLRSREQLSPLYRRLLVSGRATASGLEAEERTLGRRSVREGTSTDSWLRTWDHALAGDATEFISRGRDGTPVLRVAYAIPARAFGDSVPAVRVRAMAQANNGRLAATIDTVDRPRATVGDPGHRQVVGMVTVPIPSGQYTSRIALEHDGAGILGSRDTLEIADVADTVVGVSAPIIGTPAVPIWWIGPAGDTVWVDPTDRMSRARPMHLYFEVTGVPRHATIRVTLSVQKVGGRTLWSRMGGLFGGKGGGVRVTFDEPVVAEIVQPVQRTIDLRALKPGSYLLRVSIEARGRRAQRTRVFTVIE